MSQLLLWALIALTAAAIAVVGWSRIEQRRGADSRQQISLPAPYLLYYPFAMSSDSLPTTPIDGDSEVDRGRTTEGR